MKVFAACPQAGKHYNQRRHHESADFHDERRVRPYGIHYGGMLSFARIAHAAMPDTSRAIPVPSIAIAETKEDLYTSYTPEYDGYLSIIGLSGADSGTISVSRSHSIVNGEVLQNVSTDPGYRQGPFVPLLAGATYYIRTYNIKSHQRAVLSADGLRHGRALGGGRVARLLAGNDGH